MGRVRRAARLPAAPSRGVYKRHRLVPHVARLSIAIPTYAEATNIATMLPALHAAFHDVPLEIIVVDDDSPDGTAEAARRADPDARIIVRRGERGLATAVVRAFDEACGDWVLVMDADFQHPVDAVRRIWDRAARDDVDLVIGSRYAEGGDDAAFGRRRRAVSRGARWLAALAVPAVRRHAVTDPMSGLFAVRRRALEGVRLRPTGYKVVLEILARADISSVAEVGFAFGHRAAGRSKLGGGVMVQYVGHLARLAFVRR